MFSSKESGGFESNIKTVGTGVTVWTIEKHLLVINFNKRLPHIPATMSYCLFTTVASLNFVKKKNKNCCGPISSTPLLHAQNQGLGERGLQLDPAQHV